jgi:hypothetical protein
MKDLIYIVGICVAAVMGLIVGKAEGIQIGISATTTPVEVDVEKKCIAWFFDADLKAAKKHICGGRK